MEKQQRQWFKYAVVYITFYKSVSSARRKKKILQSCCFFASFTFCIIHVQNQKSGKIVLCLVELSSALLFFSLSSWWYFWVLSPCTWVFCFFGFHLFMYAYFPPNSLWDRNICTGIRHVFQFKLRKVSDKKKRWEMFFRF